MGKEAKLCFTLVALLCVGVGLGRNPASSCAAIAFILAFLLAERYFHDTFFDENKSAIAQLRSDLLKIKAKQDQSDLKGVFGGKN